MGLEGTVNLIIRIWLAVITLQQHSGHSENVEPRALELSVPWRPIPYHVPQQQPQQQQPQQQLISVASFDTTSKDELVHIAQHNAQILKQFNQPITQYGQQQHQQQTGGMKVQITTHQQAPGPAPVVHQHSSNVVHVPGPGYGHTPAGPKYMTTSLLQTMYPPQHKQQQPSKPFVKSDQITTLNMVHSSTPKITAAISSHGAIGVKSGKFNGQFRDPVPTHVHKSTLKPQHPVMGKLQSHLAITGFRQKQPVATSSNRLEHFINPNHLYGTYIQFGQSPALQPSPKTKFLGQLGNSGLPAFDTQTLKSYFNGPGFTPSVAQYKKFNFIQQQQQQQQQQQLLQQQPASFGGKFQFPHFNQIPAELAEFPKKYVTPSSAEKELTKVAGGIDSTPLFPHLPPSVLTPFFQQVQQQQQISGNKYNNFNLKTQHPAPPLSTASASSASSLSSGSSSSSSSSSSSFSPAQLQNVHQSDHSFFGGGGSAFNTYSTQQPLPIEHKPYEIVKFKESPGKQLPPPAKYNEIHDEYSKNLVPPPPSTQQAFLPTVLNHLAEAPSKDPIEILNKYNINPHSPLQDANRFSYEFPRPTPTGSPVPSTTSASTSTSSSSSSSSTTTTTQFPTATTLPRQQYYQQHHYNHHQEQQLFNNQHHQQRQNHHRHQQQQQSGPILVTPLNDFSEHVWLDNHREKYLTTEKPNVFRNLFRPIESEYKQHKLMHPAYTGLPPNRRPSATATTTTTSTAAAGPSTHSSLWDQSTEEPIVTHSFFTIEDAIADPTLIPPRGSAGKSKYKYTTDAEEENRPQEDDLQLEIVTIGPFFGSEESPIQQQLVPTAAPGRTKGSGGGQHRRRRPKPQTSSSTTTTTEFSTAVEQSESTEATTILNAIPSAAGGDTRNNRNRIRFRPRPISTVPPSAQAETEPQGALPATTIPPPLPAFVSSEEFDGPVKKFRKKPHFTRNRFNVLNQRVEDERSEQTEEPSVATPTATTTTTTTTAVAADEQQQLPPSSSAPALGPGFRSRYRPAPAQSKPKQQATDSQEDNLRPLAPSSTVVASTTTTTDAAVFNSDESAANFSDVPPQNQTRTRGSAAGALDQHNRPRFSIKEYRNKLNRTTAASTAASTPASETETTAATKLRFPTRNRFLLNARLNKTASDANEIAAGAVGPTGAGAPTEKVATNETTTTTRSSFRPHGTRTYNRFAVKKTASTETPPVSGNATTIQSRGQQATRGRTKLAYDQAVAANRTLAAAAGSTYNTTASLINRRPPKITLRQRIQNYNRKKEMEQSQSGGQTEDAVATKLDDPAVIEQNSVLSPSSSSAEQQGRPIDDLGTLGESSAGEGGLGSAAEVVPARASTTTEGYRHHETAIMKISPKDATSSAGVTGADDYDLNSASSDYSKRVVELTLSGTGNKDRGSFKSVNKGLLSRKVPGYFTLATEDPILPIEAFFPQVKKPGFA